jgi:hypothetical protein
VSVLRCAWPGVEGAFLHAARLELLPGNLTYEAPLPRQRLELRRELGARRARPVVVDRGQTSR